MPKQKTHSGAKKRFKVSGSGKILRQKAGRRHLLEHKPTKVTRRLDGVAVVKKADVRGSSACSASDSARRRLITVGFIPLPFGVSHTPRSTGFTSGTRKKGGQRPEEAPFDSRSVQGLPRTALTSVHQGQGAAAPLAHLRVPGPPRAQG